MQTASAPASTLVIFGASGDLTKRLLMPALYNLAGSGLLSTDFNVLGVARSSDTDEGFRAKLLSFMQNFGHKPADASDTLNHAAWDWLETRLHYMSGNYNDPAVYHALAERLGQGNAVFFMAVPSDSFNSIAKNLNAAGLMRQSETTSRRVIVEKPFGQDLETARELNQYLLSMFEEEQIYRIDHFLGKETVQNILALRFTNQVFEPLWNSNHIDHIQITAAETVGVEQRASFYESTGALKDMIPNHLFQLMALVGMESPESFDAEHIRDEKANLLNAIVPLNPHTLSQQVIRGQYAEGVVNNTNVQAYVNEPNVNPASKTETYVALKLNIDTPRWQGVPFYLRTGKHMTVRRTEIVVTFKPVTTPEGTSCANVLVFHLQPNEGISLFVNVKKPGQGLTLKQVPLNFGYNSAFEMKPSTGYESLLYDVLTGNPALYNRADSIEIGWEKVQPILDAVSVGTAPLHLYQAGSEGPAEAETILENGHQWRSLA